MKYTEMSKEQLINELELLQKQVSKLKSLMAEQKLADEKNEVANSNLAEANKKLREVNQMKSEFVSILGHNLGTPMSIILGNIEMLKRETFGKVNEKQPKTTNSGKVGIKREYNTR